VEKKYLQFMKANTLASLPLLGDFYMNVDKTVISLIPFICFFIQNFYFHLF